MTMMSVRSAAAWAIASQYVSFAIQFATSVVLARWYISPGELGLFSIAFAAVTLIAFLQDFGVTRYINGERDLTPERIQTAFTVSASFSLGVAVACIAAAWPISLFYGEPRLLPITLVVACSYLMTPLAVVPQALCQRKLDYRSNTMIEVGSAVANAAVAVILAVRGYGALALAWGAFAQQVARLVVAQLRTGGMVPWPLRRAEARPILEIGQTASILSVCGSVTARAPELVIGRLLNEVAVGLFARASGLALQLRLLVAGAVTGVFYPAFRAVRDRGDPLGPPYVRVVGAYTGIAWPAMAGIAVLAWPLIDLLYGERWLAAAPLLGWIALAQLCYVSVPLYGDLPILLDRKRDLIHRNVLDMIVSVALLALAAPHGLVWVAASRFVHGLIWIALFLPFLRSMLHFQWTQILVVYGKSALATGAAVAPLLLSFVLWNGPREAGLTQSAGGAAAGICCWFVVLALLRHPLYGELIGMVRDLSQTIRKPRTI